MPLAPSLPGYWVCSILPSPSTALRRLHPLLWSFLVPGLHSSPFRPINGICSFLWLSPHCIFYSIITLPKLPCLSVWDSLINIRYVPNASWVLFLCFWYNLPKVSGKRHHSVCRFICLLVFLKQNKNPNNDLKLYKSRLPPITWNLPPRTAPSTG